MRMEDFNRYTGALLTALVLLPNLSFGGSFSKSVSDSIEGTVNSEIEISKGIWKSSAGSSHAIGLAQGDYKVTDIAVAQGRENQMRIALQAPGEDRDKDLALYMPTAGYARVNLNVGQIVTATPRAYGLAFYQVQTREPFAVVLDDNWIEELRIKAVAL